MVAAVVVWVNNQNSKTGTDVRTVIIRVGFGCNRLNADYKGYSY